MEGRKARARSERRELTGELRCQNMRGVLGGGARSGLDDALNFTVDDKDGLDVLLHLNSKFSGGISD